MTATVEDRLNSHHVKDDSGCWRWTGSRGHNDYGLVSISKKMTRAHRAAFELWVGPIPDGLVVDHLCHDPEVCKAGDDCPHRLCINPSHLEAVTQRVNMLRSGSHVAANPGKTHCPSGHAYDAANTYIAPSRPNARYCRACHAEHSRASRNRLGARAS